MATVNKADIVKQALYKASLIGAMISSDPLTETRALALLEMMMPALENDGIYLGYKIDEFPLEADMDAESGIPDWSVDGITYLLAARVYASVMNGMRPDIEASAATAKAALYPTELIQRENDTNMPVGAGNRRGYYSPYFQHADEPITVPNDGNLDDITL